ncbi:hypothetical protein [Pseudomonas serbica]|uniref:hypothetical protein n=1 Tax=Pseudomonas serbica TaxID=2965074 RepID=UPI00237AABDB|nr:hypothetical protein [Pseudomonas serbica]
MSNYTVAELLGWMDGKSQTHGWDAVVSYDQRKTNELLHQLYVERFSSDKGYIPPITRTLDPTGNERSELYGLRLSVPKLSFDNASIDFTNSKADLTMDMVGGAIVTRVVLSGIPSRIDRIQELLPLGGPQLSMTLPLENTPGSVSGERLVTLDISKGENFKANFVVSGMDQITIGNQFKLMFEKLDDDLKVFPLGRLGPESNEALTPESFEIRTLKAPVIAGRADVNPGAGAVMMFITLAGGKPGEVPPKPNPDNPNGFRYLIPKDEVGEKFTGSMLLSSRVLFDKVIRPYAIESIGHGIDFSPYNGAADLAWALTANTGSIPVPGFEYDYNIFHTSICKANNSETLRIDFRLGTGDTPLTLRVESRRPVLLWRTTTQQFGFRLRTWFPLHPEIEPQPLVTNGRIRLTTVYKVYYDVKLDEKDGVVSFERIAVPRLILKASEHGWLLDIFDKEKYEKFDAHLYNSYYPHLNKLLQHVPVPNIDTFLIRNLLFGNYKDPNFTQALHLSRASVPGDLFLMGEIDPLRTSMGITADQSLVEIGKTLQFKVLGRGADVPTVLWSVSDPDGTEVNVGTISPQGLYQAPVELKVNQLSVLVKAEGSLDNKPVTALAMISVMKSTIAVNPIFQVTAPVTLGKPEDYYLKLTAETIDGSAPKWELLPSTSGSYLIPDPQDKDNPCTRMYVQGPKNTDPFIIDTIEVNASGGAPKQIKILFHSYTSTLYLEDDKTIEPSTGKIQLRVKMEEGDDPDDFTLALLESGGAGGALDIQSGVSAIYKEPASLQNSFAIVTAQWGSGSRGYYGFIVLPLPLSTYSQAPAMFDENNPSAVWQS